MPQQRLDVKIRIIEQLLWELQSKIDSSVEFLGTKPDSVHRTEKQNLTKINCCSAKRNL